MLKKIILYLVISVSITACNKVSSNYNSYSNVESSKIKICFTPPTRTCANQIVNEINHAKESIYMQAYGLTNHNIINSLVSASSRGVKVRMLLDKSNLKNPNLDELIKCGIGVEIDKVSGIAHNKIIIIDNQTVITGSFNFTNAADTRNAENVVFICNKNIADQYLNNWKARHNNSFKFAH